MMSKERKTPRKCYIKTDDNKRAVTTFTTLYIRISHIPMRTQWRDPIIGSILPTLSHDNCTGLQEPG
jgi:hypothetical protein